MSFYYCDIISFGFIGFLSFSVCLGLRFNVGLCPSIILIIVRFYWNGRKLGRGTRGWVKKNLVDLKENWQFLLGDCLI
jgi:hypothetical protein